MTLDVIYRLQVFSNAIRRTFVQHFTRFQLTACSHGSSASAELLVSNITVAECQDNARNGSLVERSVTGGWWVFGLVIGLELVI